VRHFGPEGRWDSVPIALIQPAGVVERELRPTRDIGGHGRGWATYSFAALRTVASRLYGRNLI